MLNVSEYRNRGNHEQNYYDQRFVSATEVRCQEKTRGGLRYEVILGEPEVKITPPKRPMPSKSNLSVQDIKDKLKAAEERRQQLEFNKMAALSAKISKIEEASRKKNEQTSEFISTTRDALEQKMELHEEKREAYITDLKSKLKDHIENVEKTRVILEQQTDEVRTAIEEKLKTASQQRNDNIKKMLDRLKEHEKHVDKVRVQNTTKLHQLDNTIQDKLAQAKLRKEQIEREQKNKLRSLVWQNDGLPAQICNKCSAKLHISFQFKKLCEKSDAKLRQVLTSQSIKDHAEPQYNQPQEELQQNASQELIQTIIPQDNCIFIECNPLTDTIPQNSNNFNSASQNLPQPLNQISYNQLNGYNLSDIGQVQVYNGTYALPLQPNNNGIQNHIIQQMQLPAPTQVTSLVQQTPLVLEENKEKTNEPQQKQTLVDKDKKIETSGKQCPTCNKTFETTTKLSRHVKTHSADMPYKCKVCNKAFAHSGNFKIHLRMHTGERPFRCNVCGKGCRQAQDLEKHMRTHTGERPHKCVICPKAFSTRSNLIAHIRTHTGERPYVCCVCQKAFCQSNELTKHMRTHTGEKSHICDICNKGFNGSSTLIVHRRSHTGERPYICLVCSKGFSQSSCLAVHMKRHNSERNYQCDQCDKSFITRAELKEHETVGHEVCVSSTCKQVSEITTAQEV